MSLKSVQSKLTTFGLTLSLVLGVVSPVFIAQVANATSAGTNDCIQDYSLTSGTGTVSVSKLNGYCYIAFKNTGGASSAATFSWTPPSTSIDYLVVAGGGGGASRHAGGGGAGGLLYSTNLSVDRGVALTMTVGAGGSGASAQPAGVGADGSNGANSSLSGGRVSTILAYGGGAGAFSTKTAINSGGSGGGAGCCTNTPGSGVAGQGNSGSNGTYGSNYWVGGGGGGAGGAGADATGTSASDAKAGNGGPGLSINWIGTDVQSALTVGAVSSSTVYFAGGGGGATAASGTGGSGGVGGGGNGASNSGTPTSGAATTGAGGGAAGLNSDNTSNAAGSGGSGVIVIRYAISDCSVTPDTSSSSGYTILKFTNVGTCSWSVPSGVTRADILIVAGGGSGGGGIGGGGGAGEFIELSNQDLTSYTGRVPITVGAGGAVTNSWTKGLAGSNSSIGSITAYGGGGGGSDRTTGPVASINNFGSEGGGGFLNTSYSGTDPQPLLGVATRSDGITGYRNNGGAGSGGGGGNATAGGGGGAGGVGAAGTSSPQSGGNGGAGRASTITGASVCYAAGGGGGLNGSWGFSSGNPGNGGNCGGSAVGGSGGAKSTNAGSDTYGNRGDGTNGTVNSNGSAGAANSGSGGGGASNWSSGGAGGSGIVVIKYVNAPAIALSSTLISATIGSAINSYAISSTGGPASNYSIPSADTTALTSAGISFNTSTGVISGTPSAVMASRSITITATNTSGTATATFSISSYYVSCTSSQDTSTMAGYSILKFTSTGTCSWQVPAGVTNVDVLVVGGGGGGGGTGGRGWSGGGGAGGQVASSNSKTVISQSQITVKVGAGGAGGSATARTSADVAKSGDSSIFGDITASGGGAGGHAMVTDYTTNDISAPTNGGGGGAQANQFGGAAYTWNSAISGGNGYLSSDSLTQSAGGGAGAGGSGSSGTSSRGGDGGSGSISNITGSNVSYAGGGGGGKRKANTSSAGSGKDGGGNGGQEAAGSNATANTGGGGGGAGGDPAGFVGGNGGSGVVIVRYALVVTYSYDLNSATSGSAPISGSAQGGTSFTTAASTGIAKTNYTFGGWCSTQPAIGAACSGTLLTANASQTMPVSASSITFYAVWTGNSQTITYANGGGTGSAPASPTSAVYGSTFTVPANPYLKNGYSFTGWSDGTNTYQPGATYPSSGSVSTNITLTAQWSSCGSSVIQAGLLVHLDAGNTCSTTGSTAAWKDISSNGNNASLQNSPTFEATLRGKYYTFGNGTTASTSSTGQYATLANGVSDFSTGFTFSFFASFSASAPANETILSFGSSQGYGTNEITVYRDSNNTLTVYTSNWNGFCSSYNNYLSNGTFRHYAITWTPGGDCSFYLDGVLNKTVTPGIQVGKTNAITGNRAVANIGRAISGSISYFGGSIGDIAIYNTPLSASDVKSNYLAQIDASTSVTYNGNNNTGGSVPTDGASPYLNGSTVKVLANTGNLAKTGYTFNGWCTAQPSAGATCASVSGTSYAGTGSATFTIGTSNVTLYAIWAPSITLTAADQLKTYTGSAVSVSNTVSLTSGTLSGSDAFTSSSGTYTYVGINGTTYASSTTAPTAMGTYSITPSAVTFTTGSASNYGITYVAGTLTITYASCSVTPVISGGKKTYSFTSTGSCSWTVPAGITKADILVVGAGGGGGNDNGGGGGGGQVKDNLDVSLSSGAVVTITVGTGGLPGCAAYSYTTSDNSDLTSGCKGSVNTGGNTGGSSSFAGGSTITSLGGNGAVGRTRTGTAASGWDTNGYNGGGVGIGQTSIPTASGNAGGSKSSDDTASGGGGGAGGVGTAGANSSKGGAGGSGTTSSITGVCYGGGGGGGSNNGTPGTASCGGAAGTGTSARSNASANLGGGGGGGGNVGGVNGGTGGSGLVVIQYITTVTVTPTTSVSTMSYGTSTGFPTTSYSTSPSVTLTTAPTCNYYASADSTFATPVTLSATTAVGSYVVHCTGAAYTTNSATIAYASDATFTVTDNAPGAPTITGITTSSGQLSVAFTAGSNTGTSITKYQYSTDGGSTWRDRASGTTASPLVISTISGAANSSLVNGTSYPVQIRAFNTVAGTASSTTSASSGATTATLSGIQIKGSAATLGTPASSIGSVVAGTITLSQLAAIDTSNSGSYVTSLTKSDSNSTTKIVKYASGVATSSFGSDVAYTTAGISDQDFFIVRVVAQDGLTTSYYKVTVTVSAPVIASSTTIANGASGASLVITGNGFKSNIATSDLTTSVGTTGLTVSSVTYNSATQITVGLTGTAVVGTVTVQVKAAGFALATSAASNTLSYVVPNSAVSTLSALVVSAGTISPTFSSGTTSYTLSVATGITSTTVTATRTQANAAITVNGSAATSGTATGSISLAYGSNTITVVVTAQDGTTTSTYTVTITRASTVPAQPAITGATIGDGQISVNVLSNGDGGSAITNWKYSTNGGTSYTAVSPASTSTTIAITGLTNGTAYSVKVIAVNANGDSLGSSAVSYTPYGVPAAPTSVVITPGNTQLSVAFTAGSDNGSAITNYWYSLNGGTYVAVSPTQTTSPIVITGLTNGTSYSVALKAQNARGLSAASSTVSSTPIAGALTPTFDTPVRTADGFTVNVTNYSNSYTWTSGGATGTGATVTFGTASGSNLPITVSGLAANTSSTLTINNSRSGYGNGTATVSGTSLPTLTVTYDSQGGSAVTSGSTTEGASISAAPTAPTKAGYTFTGWSTTSNGSVVTFPYAHGQTSNFTLYAIWSANALTITYDSQGGTSVTSGTVNTGASISAAPTAPTKAGYTFTGWSTTSNGSVVTFPYAHGQTSNFTLFAIWSVNALTVTFNSKGGSTVTNGSVNVGATLAKPTDPTKSGSYFYGWSATDGGTIITVWPYMHGQTSDFTLYAIWTSAVYTTGLKVNLDATNRNSLAAGSPTTWRSIAPGDTTLSSTVSTATFQPGGNPGRVDFTSTSGITYGNTSLANITGGVTVEAWIKLDSSYTISTTQLMIASHWYDVTTGQPTNDSQDWFFMIYDGRLQVTSGDGAGNIVGLTGNRVVTAAYAGSWIHVGFTQLANGTIQLYFNGQPQGATLAGKARHGSSTANLRIGHGTLGFVGSMSKFRLYDGALTSAQILSNFNNESSTYQLATRSITIDSSSFLSTYAVTATPPTITATPSVGSGTKQFASYANAICTINPSTGAVTFVATGTCIIAASISEDSTYAPVTSATVSFTVTLTSRTISIDSGSYTSSYTLVATPPTITSTATAGTSEGTKSYSSSTTGVCTVNSSTGVVSFVAAGTCTLTATISAGSTYASATSSSISFQIVTTVVFNNNGGSGTMANQLINSGTATTLSTNTFTRTGYTFAGWNTNADGTTGINYTDGQSVTITSGMTLYAKWTANTLTITYAAGTSGSGTGPTSPLTVSYGSTFTTPANTYTRTNYKFAGWSNGSTTYAAGATYPSSGTVTGNVTLTATWTQLTNRTFFINSSSYFPSYLQTATAPTITSTASSGTGTKTYSSTTTGICTIESSTGVVTFVSTGNCGISARIETDDTYVSVTASTIYFAITASQDGKLQSILFSAGVISPLFTSSTYSYTISVNSSTTSLTVTPTVFQSTSTTTVNGTSVTSGQASSSIALSLGRNTILVRGISQNGLTTQTYTITVNRGSTSFTISQPNGRFLNADAAMGQTFKVPQGTSGSLASISGIFISFRTPFTGVAGARIYDGPAKNTLLATSPDTCTDADSGIAPPETSADFNWVTCAPFTFTGVSLTAGSTYYFEIFRVSGGSSFFMKETESNYYPDGVVYTGSPPLNPNYLYDAAFSLNYVDSNSSSDSTLSALTISSGTLSPSFASGTSSYTVSVANSVTSITLTPTSNHSDASIAINGTSVASGSASGAISLSSGANTVTIVVTAQDGTTSSTYSVVITRAAASRTITYALGGGSGTTPTQANVLEGSTFTTAASTGLTKAGYTFNKWNDGASDYSESATYTVGSSNVTLTATWTANTLTITYNSQGGSSVTSGTVATDAKILAAPTPPTYAGYTLSGWATTSTGTPVSFTGGYTHGQTSNFTLYAIWTANGNAVVFNNNNGSGTMANQSINSGTATALSTNTFTRTGYTFAGWNTNADGTTGTSYTDGQSVTITAGMTLYAKWTGNTNTVTYDSKGGSSVANGSFITGGSVAAAPTAPTKAGYSLTGWSATDGGSAVTFPYSPGTTSGITLYALWSVVSCSPTSSTAGGYTIYTFATAGTCFWTVPNGVSAVEVLVVGAGGGGGYAYDNTGAGGGGGGQVKTGTATLSTTEQITVGGGGAGGTTGSRRGGTGANSVAAGVTALGGTGGCGARSSCSDSAQATSVAAANGGLGGGGGISGKGGGGSNVSGSLTTTTAGGSGTSSNYSGSSVTYGAGGAGGVPRGLVTSTNIAGTAGSANTGNGGGGASAKSSSGDVNGGDGGSGLVIIRVASALTITYDSQSGSAVSDGSTITGGSISSAPADPTRSNYTFVGWFTATSGGSAISFPYAHGQTANFTLYAHWSLNTYSITFNANNGSGTMGNQTVTHGVATGLNANLFTRANYVFYRWATAADGSGTTYSNLAQVTLTSGTTLYAQWTANTYVVTYNYDSATGSASTNTSSFTTGGSAITLPTPTKSGYTFAGWYSDSALTTSIGAGGGSYSPTGTTLSLNAYAKWTAINYTFTYNDNNSDSGTVPTETTKQITQTATVKANIGSLVRGGYTFSGWNTASDGTGTTYLSGAIFTVGSSNVTLYAKWSANTYTITYNANGGSGNAQRSSSNVTTDSYTTGGSSVTLPGAGTLQRSGYTFAGWNTSANGTGTDYLAAATYTTVSNLTFYAKWTAVTYSITYNGNTSDGGSAPTTGSYTTGQASPYSVLSNSFTKTSNVFGGWNTAANGSGTSYSPSATITTLADITLYATWIPQYTLHYAVNGGTVSSGSLPGDQLYNTGTVVGPVFSNMSRTGYTFDGWTNGATTIAPGGNFTILADSVLTAKWTAINYTIAYNSDGGTDAPTQITKQIGQSHTVASGVTKPGYNFAGWSNGSSVVGPGATIVTGASDVTYTAQWTPKVYQVSYDWNGGRGTAVSDVAYTFGTPAITLPTVGDRVKDGYTFSGWSESQNGSVVGATYTPSQSRTLYAQWALGNFTVTYDAGRGTVANPTVQVQNGSATTLPLPTRANFVFDGWHTANSGGTSLGSNGASFSPTASQTVYARWIQSSLYGISNSLSRIGSVITSSNIANTFSGANSNSSVTVSVPANAFEAGTTINFDLVGDSSRAVGVLPNVNYLVSIAVSWLTGNETVPETASGKPVSITISNPTIKAGAAAYAIVNNVSTLLGTATQDGTITVSITSDPEIVIAATKPAAPTSVSATSNGNQQSVISWSAPTSDGGSAITVYTVTSNTGATCTTSTTSCAISSLSNGTAYTFTVTATNTVGTSVASSSASATTASVYAVTFDSKGGSTVTSGNYLTAGTVAEPTAPTKDGYAFAGWAATDGGNVEVFPYSPGVTSNITMFARWDALDHVVTFDSTSGSAVSDGTYASGGTVAEPTAPTRSGYTFAGWSATNGGSRITFPYSPGVFTDITLYAKWTAVSSGGGSSSSSSNSNSSSSSNNSGGSSASGSASNSNIAVLPPVTVVGSSDTKIPSIQLFQPGSDPKQTAPVVKIDAASDKFIADVKIVDGALVLTPEVGFSGKKTVTVTINLNGQEKVVLVPIIVLPESVSAPVVTPTSSSKTLIKWTESPNATSYTVYVNGKKSCTTTGTSCALKNILGPKADVTIVSNGGDKTVSQHVDADFTQTKPVQVTRLVSSTSTKSTFTKTDISALNKLVALVKSQGFGTVVISQISTTAKNQKAADARLAAIKKYIEDKVGAKNVDFEFTPPSSKTIFNNIAVKG